MLNASGREGATTGLIVPVVASPHALYLLDGMSARLELTFFHCVRQQGLYCRLTELIERHGDGGQSLLLSSWRA
jgi:hypothetical protein